MQHPGGRAGFIQSLGDNRIGFGDYPGNRAELAAMYDPVHLDPSVTIEFPPSPMRDGSPLRPFICTMPGDARLEFATTDG